MGPVVAFQLTGTAVVEAELSARMACGVQGTVAPAAMCCTGFTGVRVLTRVTAVMEAVWVPALPVAVSVMAPGACGVTVVEAVPEASVRMVQVAAPQSPKLTIELVAVKVMLWPERGVTPSAAMARTAKGAGAEAHAGDGDDSARGWDAGGGEGVGVEDAGLVGVVGTAVCALVGAGDS